jgi:enoyl-CoA hydratase
LFVSDIATSVEDGSFVIRLSRPEKRNALRREGLEQLIKALLSDSANSAHAIIITGSGDLAFSAGADMAELKGLSLDAIRDVMWKLWRPLIKVIDEHPRPVIAAVNGLAYGGGFEIAATCHVRVAAENARFALPEISHGHLPGAGGMANMARLLPASAAAYYLLTGESFSAQDAATWGFVSETCPSGDLIRRAIAIGQRIGQLDPLAVELTLRSLTAMRDCDYRGAMEIERAINDTMMSKGTDAMYRGFDEFVGKARPTAPPTGREIAR